MAGTKLLNQRIFKEACAAGKAAGDAEIPVPMIVGTPKTLFGNDIDYAKQTYFVDGGVCGFAWVTVKGTTSFGRWALKSGKFRKSDYRGVFYSISEYGQSMQRKEAYARAMIRVLTSYGIDAYLESRMD